jgi:hypothetical protein
MQTPSLGSSSKSFRLIGVLSLERWAPEQDRQRQDGASAVCEQSAGFVGAGGGGIGVFSDCDQFLGRVLCGVAARRSVAGVGAQLMVYRCSTLEVVEVKKYRVGTKQPISLAVGLNRFSSTRSNYKQTKQKTRYKLKSNFTFQAPFQLCRRLLIIFSGFRRRFVLLFRRIRGWRSTSGGWFGCR